MSLIYNIANQDKLYKEIKDSKSFLYWKNMIKRCYCEKYQERRPTYKNCTVCEEWLTFSNFEKWFKENYYELDNEKVCLDKDLLIKENKIYSPHTCMFIPNRINCLFLRNKNINKKLPIGVGTRNSKKYKYKAECTVDGKTKQIGKYETIEEAKNAYEDFKIKYANEILLNYKNALPKEIYDKLFKLFN